MKFVNFSLASLLAAQPAVAMTVKGFRKQNDPARNLKKSKKKKNPTVAPTASPTIPAPENLVCYSSETTSLTAVTDTTDDVFVDAESSFGILDFGVISVPAAGGDVMLDINASTGGVINRGNDLDDDDIYMRYAFASEYYVGLGVLLRPGCTTNIGCTSSSIAPVPNALMTLNGVEDFQAFSQDDFYIEEDDGLTDYQSRTQMVSGRFFVPDLAPGDYLIEIAVMIGAIAAMDIADDEDWYSDTTVVLGPHIIVAQVLQATNRVCDPSMYMEVM
jgi:hypothetical protein